MKTPKTATRWIKGAKGVAMGIAAAAAFCVAALPAQAANIYGPPDLQANSASNAPNVSTAAVSADFNNDGYPDLAVLNAQTDQLLIYLGTPIGGLALKHDFNNLVFGLQTPNGISAGDMDGDGKMDLVITDRLGVSILKGSGNNNGDFSALARPGLADASDYGAQNPMLADLNHDGKLDIVVGVYEPGDLGGNHYFEVLQNVGLGFFILTGQYEVSYSGLASYSTIRETQLADIDGDGEADLVFVDDVNSPTVSWLKGTGNGAFAPQAQLLGVGAGVGNIEDIEIADVDGDGKLDLLLQNQYGEGVWLAKGVGNGIFLPSTKLFATGVSSGGGRDMGRVIVADVNGDGRLDVISDGYVGLQQANHSFVLNEHIGYSVTRMLAAIDLNRDGRADLVASGPGAGTIAVFKTIALAASSIVTTGTPQSTVFSTPFAQPLSIKVLDSNGVGVPGLAVSMTPVNPGPSLPIASTGSGTTNAQGVFSYTPVANGVMGCYQMKGFITGLGNVPLFNLCNTNTDSLAVTAGNNQTTLVNTAFGTPLQVRVTDASNNPKAGVTVTFGGPSVPSRVVLSSSTAVTDANGFAAVTATATGKSGAYSVSATAPGTTGASIKLSNSAPAGAAAAIAFDVSTPQWTYVTKPFSAPVTAHVQDFFGNPVQGATVVFAITTDPVSGATASFSALTAVTDAAGNAQVSGTANGFVGTYSVKASVQGSALVSPQTRLLRNVADLPKFMTTVSGTPQSTPINTTFAQKLRVKVTGWDGSNTPQVRVYFITSGGVVLSAESALADAGGFAEVTATADATVGLHQVSAIVYDTVLEQPITQTFALTNIAGSIPPGGGGGPVSVPANSPLALMGLSLAMLALVRRRMGR
ncbi:VCBS repeat-containing protein [Acidovorax sp. sif1233]|uniref:FG-GAP-like repeat-containing protein n=1 Tax=Acidovorax sp. sif1233 TaxID=2854792 RepID=UPI001C441A06|nr:FG-GAP-like repeat-containing protein [Acidovorax sp. sif1233]MBV7456995.1 VCBS repeat-containing protein [Acidovorax sp. sif1233]